jgi:hypothetical protein
MERSLTGELFLGIFWSEIENWGSYGLRGRRESLIEVCGEDEEDFEKVEIVGSFFTNCLDFKTFGLNSDNF